MGVGFLLTYLPLVSLESENENQSESGQTYPKIIWRLKNKIKETFSFKKSQANDRTWAILFYYKYDNFCLGEIVPGTLNALQLPEVKGAMITLFPCSRKFE